MPDVLQSSPMKIPGTLHWMGWQSLQDHEWRSIQWKLWFFGLLDESNARPTRQILTPPGAVVLASSRLANEAMLASQVRPEARLISIGLVKKLCGFRFDVQLHLPFHVVPGTEPSNIYCFSSGIHPCSPHGQDMRAAAVEEGQERCRG